MQKLVFACFIALLPSYAVAHEDYFSLQVMVGNTDQKITDQQDTSQQTLGHDRSRGIRFSYRPSQYWGVQLSYIDHGTAVEMLTGEQLSATNQVKSAALQLGIYGALPLGKTTSLYARAGVSSWESELTQTSTGVTDLPALRQGEDSDDAPYYSVGLQYTEKSGWNIALEFNVAEYDTEYDGDFNNSKSTLSIETISLTYGKNF